MSSDEGDDTFQVNDFSKIHDEIEKLKTNDSSSGMFVSGWDDDNEGIDDSRHPQDINEKNILKAAENGNLQEVIDILNQDSSVISATDKDGYTPLHRACYGDHLDVVNYLISKGAEVNARTNMGWAPLHSACRWNNYKCVARLLASGADINARSDGDQTPLHIASTNSHSRETIVSLLLHPDIDPSILNNSDESAEDIAKRSGMLGYLFKMADPTINFIKSREFTDNPLMRDES